MFPLYFEFNELGPGADLVGWGGGGGGGVGGGGGGGRSGLASHPLS